MRKRWKTALRTPSAGAAPQARTDLGGVSIYSACLCMDVPWACHSDFLLTQKLQQSHTDIPCGSCTDLPGEMVQKPYLGPPLRLTAKSTIDKKHGLTFSRFRPCMTSWALTYIFTLGKCLCRAHTLR